MGYNLNIEGSGISMSDWLAYIEQSDLLTRNDEVTGKNPRTGEVITIPTPNAAISADGLIVSAWEREEKLVLSAKFVDERTIELLKKISTEIGGTVVGEEGEEY